MFWSYELELALLSSKSPKVIDVQYNLKSSEIAT